MTSNELANKFNVSRGMITKLWYDAGLKGKVVVNPKTTEKDIIGQTFGYWQVLSKSSKRSASGGIYYNCLCTYDNCGTKREVLGTRLRSGNAIKCRAHGISKGNEKIKKILKEAKIPFETEKVFETCKDKTYLPFDFYVNNTYLIEYDGEQHFNKESYFDYETTHFHDLIKNQWCKENHIPLIRIPYTYFEKIELKDLLLEQTKFLI